MNAKTSLFAAAIVLSLLLGLTLYAQKQNGTRVAWEYHVWSFNTWQEATAKLYEDRQSGLGTRSCNGNTNNIRARVARRVCYYLS